jgi:hypothetical protein
MSITDLAYGKRVIWRTLDAVIIDICWTTTPLVRIRLNGNHTHWTTADQLEVAS